MKNLKIHNSLIILLLVYFNTFSISAYNSSAKTRDLDPRNFEVSPSDLNNKGLFFEEISFNPSLQSDSEDHSNTSGIFTSPHYFSPQLSLISCKTAEWSFVQDKRGIIAAQIFPFHFFW